MQHPAVLENRSELGLEGGLVHLSQHILPPQVAFRRLRQPGHDRIKVLRLRPQPRPHHALRHLCRERGRDRLYPGEAREEQASVQLLHGRQILSVTLAKPGFKLRWGCVISKNSAVIPPLQLHPVPACNALSLCGQ